MRASSVLQATWQRIRRPRSWGAALLFGVVWNGSRVLMGMAWPDLGELVIPSIWVLLFLVLAPLPWQWTGDDAPMAPTTRGAIQALPWMLALTFGMLLLLTSTGGSPPMRRGPGLNPSSGVAGRGGPHHGTWHREESRWIPFHPRLWILGVAHLSFGLLLGWILADRERAESQEATARRAANEAQARVLQGQMNPHVLFNAISGLTELVREDPVAAEGALVNLSNLLRMLLDHGSRMRAPLGDEHRLVELHLSLERLRLGRRLRESWDWPTSLDGLEIPPLMIQPLVENALKHGVSVAIGGGELAIKVSHEEGVLHVRVANTGPAPTDEKGTGLGLRNLRERLSLLGAPSDALQLHRDGDWTVAELHLAVKA